MPIHIETPFLESRPVITIGDSCSEANDFALAMLNPNDAYIHPFDDPLWWTGHASLVDEMVRQGPKPDAIVLSVGGGGSLCGVIERLRRTTGPTYPSLPSRRRAQTRLLRG